MNYYLNEHFKTSNLLFIIANDPGPGQYDLKTDINKSGSYFVSRFRSSVGRSFGTSPRRTGQLGYCKCEVGGGGGCLGKGVVYKRPSSN